MVAYTKDLDGLYIIDNCARFGLPVSDCGGPATKWKGGGPGRGVWRYGVADGVRSSRLGDAAFKGDDGFGDSIYADVAQSFDPGNAADRGRKNDSGKAPGSYLDESAGDSDACSVDSSASHGNTGDRRSEAWTTVGHADGSKDGRKQDSAVEPRNSTSGRAAGRAAAEEVAAVRSTRRWRNWQTH